MILNNGNIEVCLRFFIAHMHSTVDLFSASVKYSFLFSWTLCHAFPFMRSLSPPVQRSTGGGGGYFLVKGYWGCAAGWGRIFTTGLTILGLHF